MSNVMTKEMVELSLAGTNKQEAIRNMAKLIDATGRLADFDGYYHSVLEREELTSTGIGFGIAIPHGKSEHVTECAVAFGRLKEQLDWQSLDNKPVEIVFLLAVPEASAGEEHLKIISGLSRKLIHEDFRTLLQTTNDEEEIVNVINESLQSLVNC